MCHTASYYYVGKDPTFAFGTAVPFGLNSRMQTAWLQVGGGGELMNEFYKKYNIIAFLARQHGLPDGRLVPQGDQGAWRPERLEDAHRRLRRPGAVRSSASCRSRSARGEIYPALEKGTIDAAEWVGPYDDQKLGFNKVAKYYYYPGWWEGGPSLHNFVNLDKWNALPPAYKSIIKTASSLANETMQARYDAYNPAALKQLIAGGAELRPFSPAILEACLKAANEVYAETGGQERRLQEGLRRHGRRSAATSISGGRWRKAPTTTS